MNPYAWYLKIRDSLYEHQQIKTFKADIPVISVGNLNTGGSGKTPFIEFLVKEIQQKNPSKKIVIVSKSYKAQLTEPREVTEKDIHSPEVFGDEACLLKSLLKVDVWSGPVKYQTLQSALKHKKYDVAIIDDGFSHLKIKKDLNIVVFDVSRRRSHYRLLPFGRMREPWSALKRSDLVVFTKIENQEIEKINDFRKHVEEFQKNCITANFTNEFRIKEKGIFLFTGIGHPESLIEGLKKAGFSIEKNHTYADHYNFPSSVQQKLWDEYSQLKNKFPVALVTTQKDYIKIKHPQLLKHIQPLNLKVDMSNENKKVLHDQISQLF